MRISATFDYAATPDEVFAMLTDAEFQRRKCQATGALNQTVSVTEQGDATVIVTKRTMPTDDFPDFVKGMVGQTLILTENFSWGPAAADGSRDGTMTVELGNAPVGLSCTLHLGPGGSGSLEQVEGDLKARVPLLGGKIEKAAAPAVESAIRVERSIGTEWLALRA